MKIKYLHLLFLLLLGSTLWMSNNFGFATMNPSIGGATFAPNEVSVGTAILLVHQAPFKLLLK